MTTNPTHIPEPTPLTSVAVGKRNGQTAVAVRSGFGTLPWFLRSEGGFGAWCDWTGLCAKLTDIRVVDVTEEARPTKVAGCARCDRIEAHALGIEGLLGRRRDQLAKAREEIDQLKARIAELEAAKPCECRWCVAAQRRDRMQMGGMVIAPCDEYGRTDREKYGDGDLPYGLTMAEDGSYLDWRGEHYTRTSDIAAKPEPGPWLRGAELAAVMPTLKEGDKVEVEHEGHTAAGELWGARPGGLLLGMVTIRWSDGKPGPYVDALRIIERAPEPEPGADIPDEVVDAADAAYFERAGYPHEAMRSALAAADAKRAELEGQA